MPWCRPIHYVCVCVWYRGWHGPCIDGVIKVWNTATHLLMLWSHYPVTDWVWGPWGRGLYAWRLWRMGGGGVTLGSWPGALTLQLKPRGGGFHTDFSPPPQAGANALVTPPGINNKHLYLLPMLPRPYLLTPSRLVDVYYISRQSPPIIVG